MGRTRNSIFEFMAEWNLNEEEKLSDEIEANLFQRLVEKEECDDEILQDEALFADWIAK